MAYLKTQSQFRTGKNEINHKIPCSSSVEQMVNQDNNSILVTAKYLLYFK
jgi:hypothetical protein